MLNLGICYLCLSPDLGGLERADLLAAGLLMCSLNRHLEGRIRGTLCKRNLIPATRVRRGKEPDNAASVQQDGVWEPRGSCLGWFCQ